MTITTGTVYFTPEELHFVAHNLPSGRIIDSVQNVLSKCTKIKLKEKCKNVSMFCNSTAETIQQYVLNKNFLIGFVVTYIILSSCTTRPVLAVEYLKRSVLKKNKRSWKEWMQQNYNKVANSFPAIRKLETVDYELVGYGILLASATCYVLYDEINEYFWPQELSFAERFHKLGVDQLPDKKIENYGRMAQMMRKVYNWATQDPDTQKILFSARTEPNY